MIYDFMIRYYIYGYIILVFAFDGVNDLCVKTNQVWRIV